MHNPVMAYELRAFIGPVSAVTRASLQLGVEATALPQGFALVPLPLVEGDAPLAESEIGDPCLYLTEVVSTVAATASKDTTIAYVDAESFGSAGTQAAALWNNGTMTETHISCSMPGRPDTAPISSWAINTVLRQIGVVAGALDEFEALGLGRHRDTEAWQRNAS